MTVYVKWGGLALMLIAALYVSGSYRRYVARRISEQEGLIALLAHIEGKISRYLTPPCEALRDFSNEALENIGFLREISKGASLSSALLNTLTSFAVGVETKKILKDLFAKLGGGYKEQVLADIREASSRIERILASERESLPKEERVCAAVTLAGSLGIFILLA